VSLIDAVPVALRSALLILFQFEKVFVVGLPSCADRHDGTILAAALSNLDIEYVDAVHVKDVPGKATSNGSQPDYNRMPNENVGMQHAHLNAIQE
jgi:hypothetical protein